MMNCHECVKNRASVSSVGRSLGLPLVVALLWLVAFLPALAGQTVIPLTDPNAPVVLEVELLTGDIVVEGYDGDQVTLYTDWSDEEDDEDHDDRRDGLRRLPGASFGVVAEEENNVVEVHMSGGHGEGVRLRVPRRTSVKAATVNDGEVLVEGVDGEHELQNTNGGVSALDISGTVQAESVNGDILVRMRQVGKLPMAFSSLNGDLDVTLPPNYAATLSLQTMNGEIYTDFDVALHAGGPKRNQERVANRFRVEIEQAVVGKINGGGAEVKMWSHNGDILIRKGN